MVEDFLSVPRVIKSKHFVFVEEKGYWCKKVHGEVECMGEHKGRKKLYPEVSDPQMTKLRDFYRPFNENLYKLVGRNFNWP